jgi:hypothetical protein
MGDVGSLQRRGEVWLPARAYGTQGPRLTANRKRQTANRSPLAPFPNSWKIAAHEIITERKTDAFWFAENHEA